MIKYFLVLFFSFFGLSNLKSQSNRDSVKMSGKWGVCTSLEFSKDFNCDSGYVMYEFFENGTFKDPRPSFDGGGSHPYSLGKWQLLNDELTMDEDDTEYKVVPARRFKISFITKTKFFTIGQEGKGGVIVYTYFQKK